MATGVEAVPTGHQGDSSKHVALRREDEGREDKEKAEEMMKKYPRSRRMPQMMGMMSA
jgi:hypothetical protein